VVLASVLAIGLALAAFSIFYILRLEREARLRYEEIVRARSELEKLSAKLVATQEEERRSISRELHDEVGQSLSALLVDLGNLGSVALPGNPEVTKHRVLSARLRRSARGSETVALRHPVMPVANSFGGGVVWVNSDQL